MPMRRVANRLGVLGPSHRPPTVHVERWKKYGSTRARIAWAGLSASGRTVNVNELGRMGHRGTPLKCLFSLSLQFAEEGKTVRDRLRHVLKGVQSPKGGS